jgi:hypothetical protein
MYYTAANTKAFPGILSEKEQCCACCIGHYLIGNDMSLICVTYKVTPTFLCGCLLSEFN